MPDETLGYEWPDETLGYEWDEPVDNGFQPSGEIDMSKTCENVSQLLVDPRSGTAPGNACNSMTLYKSPRGLVGGHGRLAGRPSHRYRVHAWRMRLRTVMTASARSKKASMTSSRRS
jgi:hypothetical protein